MKDTKVTFLSPLTTKNPLSTQLMRETGETYNSRDFYSYHDPSKLVAAGVIVNRSTGARFFVPFKPSVSSRDLDCIKEIARIVQHSKDGVGAYQWGDTSGPDGGYGKETLDSLIEFGLAERTGRNVPNQLGGAWPEVKVTALGKQVSQGYADWVRDRFSSPSPSM